MSISAFEEYDISSILGTLTNDDDDSSENVAKK